MRSGSRLDARSVRHYGWILAGLNLLSLAFLLATSRGGVDRFGHILGTDFLSFWAAGKMLIAGAAPYDAAAHVAVQSAVFDAPGGYPAFFYPPLFLIFCLPLGLAPYFVSIAAWLAITGAAYVAALRVWLKELDFRLSLPLWLAAFSPVFLTITHGQTSFLSAALLGAGLFLVPRKPVIAGLMLGLATFKPQFGLLIPVALLLTGSWRTIAAAVFSAAMLALVNTVLFGPEVWADWHALTSKAQDATASGEIGFAKMITVFAGARLIGLSDGVAFALQAIASITVIAAIAWASWRRGWSDALAALVLAGAALATPFALDYDLLLLGFPLLWIAATGFRDFERWGCALAFVAPIIARPLAMQVGVPIMPFVLALILAFLLKCVPPRAA
ncbi:glycosyltransferase family 87 protein [Croceicoccus naphthovorans]|uniref:DUF2029 domain-containing protein n=2 Tax=Croceicoccus naphthovorans TaxID=1348774 RepID=A0A0G3XFM4_9SPHN|nr:glycosyltransferase family 87 protein [Croceicoccus naphthovorans]AKM10002.1 hypothetical protein AB433_08460 [Croceicoccus naphthovorans]